MQKFYVDQSGAYIGSFDGVEPTAGTIEVPTPPEDVRQIWSGNGWIPPYFPDSLRTLTDTYRDSARSVVSWNGHLVDADDASIGKIVGRALAYSAGLRTSDSVWIMSDNSMVTLTMAEFLDMAAAVDAAVDAAYVKAGNIKELITNGTIEAPDQVSEAWNE